MIFRRMLLLTIMLLALAGLSACTRERTPWPTSTPTYGVEAMTTPMPIDASHLDGLIDYLVLVLIKANEDTILSLFKSPSDELDSKCCLASPGRADQGSGGISYEPPF